MMYNMEFRTYEILLGGSFYLDLKMFNQRQSIITDLKKLGAKVEEFLSKDVNYVITDRVAPLLSSSGVCMMIPPESGVSGQGLLRDHFFTLKGLDTPLTTSPPCDKAKSHMFSRGQSLLQQATKFHSCGTTDVLEVCRQWHIKILHVQRVMKWIEKVKACLLKKKKTKSAWNSDVFRLAPPFIKVEDVNRLNRPLFKFKRKWPELRRFLNSTNMLSKGFNDSSESNKENFSPSYNDFKGKKKLWKYCEICGMPYSHLDYHLNTEKHQQFTSNSGNYAALQNLLALLPTVKDFLLKVERESLKNIVSQDESPITSTFLDMLPLDLSNNPIAYPSDASNHTQVQHFHNTELPQYKGGLSSDRNKSVNSESILYRNDDDDHIMEYTYGSWEKTQSSNNFSFPENNTNANNHCAVLIDGIHYLQGDISVVIPFLNEMRYKYGNISVSPKVCSEHSLDNVCESVKNFVSTIGTEYNTQVLDLTTKKK